MKIRDDRKYFVFSFMAGFLAGILYANIVAGDYIAGTGIFSELFLKTYGQVQIDPAEFVWYAVGIRFVPAAFLAAFGCTGLRKAAALIYILWTGFLGGMMLTAAVIAMGAKGMLLCILGLMPHILCYGAGYLILLWFLFTYPRSRWNLSKTVCFLLFMLTGLLLECYVNPALMKIFIGTL